ncbi:MAG: selenocysteine-specific translation elongation factor [Acidimicrobiia bacterium]
MPVVGTAGHVDHGKSTLIQALTGRDPDRWEEEKRRGLTIDLGFAWTTLDGVEVSFVDVPGHERFIKNMLAGTEGMDVALLVVAADEGWMPQSEEHLSVLDLLGIGPGVVAVTKADRVDAEHLQLVILELEDQLEGTSMAGAPMVVTSVPDGTGISDLQEALSKAITELPSASLMDRPRLWIDRAFTIPGAGTVVTGTLTEGNLEVGDLVELLPTRRQARIRSLQSHEQDRLKVEGHSRVAANLAGVDRENVQRGMLLAPPGHWTMSRRITASLRTVRTLGDPLTAKGAYHLHMGTGAWPVRLRLLEASELKGTGFGLLEADAEVPFAVGDRFILREVGRKAVVAGGRVLDPEAPARARLARASLKRLEGILDVSPDEQATMLLEVRGRAGLKALSAQTRGGRPHAAALAADEALSPAVLSTLRSTALDLVNEFHRDNPLRPGVPKASLASGLGVTLSVLDALIAETPELTDEGAAVAARGFDSALTPDGEAAWKRVTEELRAAGLSVPRASELSAEDDLLHAMVRKGHLVAVSEELLYLPEQLDDLRASLNDLSEPFTVAQFRDAFSISRKYAVPLLEWLDSEGVTQRRGDLRSLKPS